MRVGFASAIVVGLLAAASGRRTSTAVAKRSVLSALSVVFLVGAPVSGQRPSFVDANGARIAYRDVGEGEPLLLLHGFGETGSTWDAMVSELGARYRLIIPDLRGHGRSTNPVDYFTHRDAARDMIGLLDELGIERTRAAGFSSGGMVLLHMATRDPERLSALAVVAAGPYLSEQAREIMRSMDADAMPMSRLDEMGLVYGDTAQARRLLRQFVGFQDSYTDVNFTRPLLSTITARTLVVYGDRDPFFPLEQALELQASVTDAYLMVFPNQGHVPFPGDEEGRRYYAETLLRFFGGEWQ